MRHAQTMAMTFLAPVLPSLASLALNQSLGHYDKLGGTGVIHYYMVLMERLESLDIAGATGNWRALFLLQVS